MNACGSLLTPQGLKPFLLRGEVPPFPIPEDEVPHALNSLDQQVNRDDQEENYGPR